MTGAGRPLRWNEIEAHLIEVGVELEQRGLTRSIIVVGGAYVATEVCAPRRPMSTPSTNSTTNSEVPSPPSPSGTDSNTIGSTTGPGRGDRSPSTPQRARRSWIRAVYEFWRHPPKSLFS